jgi:Uncharacterized conserved protein
MKPTAELIREHERIRQMLVILSKISDELKTTRMFYPEDLESIIEFVYNYWDKCHCRKEEKVLFPTLLTEMKTVGSEDVGFMIQEHEFGRNYLKEIRSCIENCKIGNPFSIDILVDCLSTYSVMIKNHMSNEENYFFPLTDKMLSKEVQDQVCNKFDSIDRMYEKYKLFADYQAKYKMLEKKYLLKVAYIEAGNSNFFGMNC